LPDHQITWRGGQKEKKRERGRDNQNNKGKMFFLKGEKGGGGEGKLERVIYI